MNKGYIYQHMCLRMYKNTHTIYRYALQNLYEKICHTKVCLHLNSVKDNKLRASFPGPLLSFIRSVF